MIARVVTNQVRDGAVEHWLALIRDAVVPSLQGQRGFRGFVALTSTDSNTTIGYSMWDDEESLATSEADGDYQRQIAKLGSVLAGPPARGIFRYVVVSPPEVRPGG